MKKIWNYLILAASLLTAAACTVKEVNPIDDGEYTLTFLLDNEIKSTLENNYMAWQEGDQIGWFNSKNAQKGASTIDLSATPYSFTIRSNAQIATKATFYFYAPYKEGDQTRTSAPLSIPVAQNGNMTNAMPMVALPIVYNQKVTANTDTNVGTAQFVALASIAQFKVFTTNPAYGAEQVQSINFTSSSDIAGDFTVNLTTVSTGSIPAPSGLSGKSITATLAAPVAVGASKDAAAKVHMSIAPGSFTGTVTVETTGATYVYPVSSAITFNRGRFLPINLDLASSNATRTPKESPMEALLTSTTWKINAFGEYYGAKYPSTAGATLYADDTITFNADHTLTYSIQNGIFYWDNSDTEGYSWAPTGTERWALEEKADGTYLTFSGGGIPLMMASQTDAVNGSSKILSLTENLLSLFMVITEWDNYQTYVDFVPADGSGGGEDPDPSIETTLTSCQWELATVTRNGTDVSQTAGNKMTLFPSHNFAFDCTANSGMVYDYYYDGGLASPDFSHWGEGSYWDGATLQWSVSAVDTKNYLTFTTLAYPLVIVEDVIANAISYEIATLTESSLVLQFHNSNGDDFTISFTAAGAPADEPEPELACPYWHNFANGDWGIGPVHDWGGWEDGYYYEQLTHPANLEGASWDLTDAGYFEWAGTQAESGWRHGIQLATNGMTISSFKLTSLSFSGEITKVTLGYNSGITDGSSLTVSCKVGGEDFGSPVAHGDGDYEAVFTGSASGSVEITISSTTKGAVWLYYIAVEYDPGSSGGLVGDDPFDTMTPAQIRAAYSPAWQDEFEGSSVNTGSTGWVFQTGGSGWGNNELQYYVNQSIKIDGTTYNTARVSDGTLKINAYKATYGSNNYISARMYTRMYWKHGLVEMRAKLPTTRGCWSAFWMLPKYGSSYVRDSSMDGGELDIMEYVPNDGANKIYFSAHSYYTTPEAQGEGDYVPYPGNVDFSGTYTLNSNTAAAGWHTYSLLWTDKYVKAYVDDNLYYQAPNPYPGQKNLPYWGFNQSFYILLNLAVGGNWGGTPAGTWPNPAVYEIDYVKVYQSGY